MDGLGVNNGVGFGAVGAGADQITRGSRVVGVGRNDVCVGPEQSASVRRGFSRGGSTLIASAGVCVTAAGSRRAEGARCTGARLTLGDGARGAGETIGTAGGDRRPAAESKILANWRMARSWSWTSVAKGAAGDRLARASIKSQAARWASSTEGSFSRWRQRG